MKVMPDVAVDKIPRAVKSIRRSFFFLIAAQNTVKNYCTAQIRSNLYACNRSETYFIPKVSGENFGNHFP